MFMHMSIHYPKDKYKNQLINSMQRFKNAPEGSKGFIEGTVLDDENTGRFVGMIKWNSKENLEKNIHLATEAVKNDNFDKWESQHPESFYLHEQGLLPSHQL